MDIIKRTFLAVLSMGLLASCSNPKTPTVTKEYLVEFNTDSGSFIPTQRIKENGTITKPENPTKEYYKFEYWKHDGLKFEDSDFNNPVTDNMTLKAEWSGGPTPEEGMCLVTFDSTGGDFVDAVVIPENQIIPEKDRPIGDKKPTKEIEEYEFTFKYWYLDGQEETAFDFDTTQITEKYTVLHAKWEGELPDYHLVNFDSNGGSFVPSRSIKHGNPDGGAPTNPTKKIGDYEFTFDNWYLEGSPTPYTFDQPVNSDLKLIAKWTGEEPKKYAYVDFETNGGSHIDTAKVLLNTPVNKPDPDPTKTDGSTFDGWYDNATFSGNEYDFAKNVETEKFTLYAKWKNPTVKHTITFVMNEATSEQIEPIEVTDGTKVPADKIPDDPTKSGYKFKGWFKDAQCSEGQEFKFETETISQDYILYAKWGDLKTYQVEFYDGNIKLDSLDQTVDYGDKVQRPANPTKANVTFSGWYQEEALTNLYNFDNKLTDLDKTDPVKIYAKWDNTMFAVNFASNGGTFVQPKNIVSGGTIAVAPETTYEGHTFGGWYTDDVTFKNAFKFGPAGTGDPITSATVLYAKWTLIVYDVKIDYNYEGSTPKNIKVNYNEVIPAQPTPEQYSYNFTGWYDAASGGNAWNFDTKVTENTYKATIYAHWEKAKCGIFFDAKGGSVSPISISVDVGSTYSQIKDQMPTPIRSGNKFSCWNASETSTEPLPETFKFNTDTVLYAHWIPQTKMLHFMKEDPTAEGGYSPCVAAPIFDGYVYQPKFFENQIKSLLTKDGYDLPGFATTIEGAKDGDVEFEMYDDLYEEVTITTEEVDAQPLYPIYKERTHTLQITRHDKDIYTDFGEHGTYEITYNGTLLEEDFKPIRTISFSEVDINSISIKLKAIDADELDTYKVRIPNKPETFYKNSMFPVDGSFTGIKYVHEMDSYEIEITITNPTSDIYLDAWLYYFTS